MKSLHKLVYSRTWSEKIGTWENQMVPWYPLVRSVAPLCSLFECCFSFTKKKKRWFYGYHYLNLWGWDILLTVLTFLGILAPSEAWPLDQWYFIRKRGLCVYQKDRKAFLNLVNLSCILIVYNSYIWITWVIDNFTGLLFFEKELCNSDYI